MVLQKSNAISVARARVCALRSFSTSNKNKTNALLTAPTAKSISVNCSITQVYIFVSVVVPQTRIVRLISNSPTLSLCFVQFTNQYVLQKLVGFLSLWESNYMAFHRRLGILHILQSLTDDGFCC